MTQEVNVLVFGHAGSGKSSIISKVLEVGGHITRESIESYKRKGRDESQPDWYLHYVKAAKNPKPTFARTFYQADGRKFNFLEFQSNEDYVPKLMKKTKCANVGVLVVSGISKDNQSSDLEALQTRKYFQLFRAICRSQESVCHVSSKLIVLINKNDSENFYNGLHKHFVKYLTAYAFDTAKVKIIPISSHSDKDIRDFLSALSGLAASQDYCLGSESCGITNALVDSIFKDMWDELIKTDVLLDDQASEKRLWYDRARTLYVAGTNLLDWEQRKFVSLEASRIIKMAFKAARKAISDDNVGDALLYLILSHGHFENGEYASTIQYYEKAKKLPSHTMQTHVTRVADLVDKAKKWIKQPHHGGKDCKKDQREVEKSDVEETGGTKTQMLDDKESGETKAIKDKDKLVDIEVPQESVKINVSSSMYWIDDRPKDTLYTGGRMIFENNNKKSFIPVELHELQEYNVIEHHGLRHPNLLTLFDMIKSAIGDSSLDLLVVEAVETIDWFFNNMFEKFVEDRKCSIKLMQSMWSSNEQSEFMKSWWNHIAERFQIIFGDVVNGLLYIYSEGLPCRGLSSHIYVSEDMHGRILCGMDKTKSYKDDIVDLIAVMKNVIYQPQFGLHATNDYLPPELEHFLRFVKKKKLSYVSAAWLLDQPYFWCSAKRVKFMRKLRKCIQSHTINLGDIDQCVSAMMKKEFGVDAKWFDYLTDPMLKAIWKKGEDKNSSVLKYSSNGDIVRFFHAVCSHANEKGYLCGSKPLKDAEFEEIFRSHFPRIYTWLVEFLYEGASWTCYFKNLNSSEVFEWFLSSSAV